MDAIVFLSEKAQPRQELTYSLGLAKACRDHVLDVGPKGLFSHTGSDGTTPAARASRHVASGEANVENLAFIDESAGLSPDAESVITQMLINDGELDRDTRNNLLSGDFTHVGVACGCHATVGEVCCFAYGTDVDDGAQARMQSLTDVPKDECAEQASQGQGRGSPSNANGSGPYSSAPRSPSPQPNTYMNAGYLSSPAGTPSGGFASSGAPTTSPGRISQPIPSSRLGFPASAPS